MGVYRVVACREVNLVILFQDGLCLILQGHNQFIRYWVMRRDIFISADHYIHVDWVCVPATYWSSIGSYLDAFPEAYAGEYSKHGAWWSVSIYKLHLGTWSCAQSWEAHELRDRTLWLAWRYQSSEPWGELIVGWSSLICIHWRKSKNGLAHNNLFIAANHRYSQLIGENVDVGVVLYFSINVELIGGKHCGVSDCNLHEAWDCIQGWTNHSNGRNDSWVDLWQLIIGYLTSGSITEKWLQFKLGGSISQNKLRSTAALVHDITAQGWVQQVIRYCRRFRILRHCDSQLLTRGGLPGWIDRLYSKFYDSWFCHIECQCQTWNFAAWRIILKGVGIDSVTRPE